MNMFINIINVCLICLEVTVSTEIWKVYQAFPELISWDHTITDNIVFVTNQNQESHCSMTCSKYTSCHFLVIYKKQCYGLSDVQQNSSLNSYVKMFAKIQGHGCLGDGFVHLNGVCILISKNKLNWFDAKRYCERQNAQLISLDTTSKHDQLVKTIETYYPYYIGHYFIGASDIEQEGNWTWIAKNSNGYFRWQPNQPNNIDTRHNEADCCIFNANKMELKDEYCDQPKHFICEA